MVEWIYNRNGRPTVLFDDDCLRNNRGVVIAWIHGNNIYSLRGMHIGWFEGRVLYDSHNKALGFLRNPNGRLPSIPGLAGAPGVPGLAGKPGRPGLAGVPGRPGFGGWSQTILEDYF
ncbi:collagen-like triple helix repeat-containing protein [Kosakonia radicincitans]|uniref:collagen-like triple helix repeat-containing protein n=1 Tax=Kosakonia radicincitans TaxID=283686 RepID=UPI0011AB373F|nr:collagen-like protein [Kosakonia radicincitans]